MPLIRGQDKQGPYYQYGKTGKKYHYIPNDKASRTIAKNKAKRQGMAEGISRKR